MPPVHTSSVLFALQQHVRLYLRAPYLAEEERRRRAREISAAGGRVVQGRMTSPYRWELHDWLTGEVVAGGHDGPAGMESALSESYPADILYAEIPGPAATTPGLPPSLLRAIERWVCDPGTPDEDIAALVEWPVSEVREHR